MQTHPITDQDRWMEILEEAACASDTDLAGGLKQLESRASISLPMLAGPVLATLANAADGLAFRPARAEVGKPEQRVYQEFGYCDAIPAGHPLTRLACWMESRVLRALAKMAAPPIPLDFTINDVVCQAYRPGDLGITPHRDHVSYTGLVILLVLSGRGRYQVCADRAGNGRIQIPAEPGWAILMPGPGFAGRSDRPFHMVDDIRALRYSVGLRHDARKPAEN